MPSITITVKDENITKLDVLADSQDRSRSWLVNEAIENYLEHQAWMDRETEAAIAEIEAGGEMIPHAEAMRRLDSGKV